MVNPRTFFDLSIDNTPAGRVVFELFQDTVPKTAENFRCLCTGERGISSKSGKPLHYKGAPIHRVIDQFMIQGGDTTRGDGKGGESIYGGPFEDESLDREVDSAGLLVMANRGPGTNSSQFFLTLAPAQHLNGKHVVFGRVVSGMQNVEAIGKLEVDPKDRPLQPVVISNCGELELRKKAVPSKIERQSRSLSASPSSSTSSSHRKKKKRKNRSEGKEVKKDKKHKKKKRQTASPSPVAEPTAEEKAAAQAQQAAAEAQEQELERERQAAEGRRKKELERMREKLGGDQKEGGIQFKGRGQMKYRDGEFGGMRGW